MQENPKRPNILLFMTDQEQAQVTLSGHPCLTPNLEKLAQEGIRFTYAYPPMAHCCPSRASFMTGLYPSQHGIRNNVLNEQAICKSLKAGVETFSEKLREAGYDLYYGGKWHVSATENPRHRGWEELYVSSGIDNDDTTRRQRFREQSGELYKTGRKNGEISRPGWGTYRLYGTADHEYTESKDYKIVKTAAEKLKTLKDSPRPWCMYIGTKGPHDPFIIPKKYAKLYDPNNMALPPNYFDDLKDKPMIYRKMRKIWDQLTEYEVKESIAYYWGYCTMLDDMFGEVLQILEQTGQKDNTLVIFMSDHGEHGGAHGLYLKGISTFDEGYRVPCIMRWPNGIKNPGRLVDEFVTMMDIAPTLTEVSGAQEFNKCAGSSLGPFLRNENSNSWRDSIYIQCDGVEVYYTQRMVRTKKYKFVYNPVDIDELYDLENDPYELHNLADDPKIQDIKREMYVKLWENAYKSEDTIFNGYPTVSVADLGPSIYVQ